MVDLKEKSQNKPKGLHKGLRVQQRSAYKLSPAKATNKTPRKTSRNESMTDAPNITKTQQKLFTEKKYQFILPMKPPKNKQKATKGPFF